MARKANPMAKRAMQIACDRGVSLKEGWRLAKGGAARKRGGRKSRKSSAPRAPRRRRSTMARKRKSGGRRKAIKITPKRLAKGAVVVLSLMQGGPLVKEVSYIATHASQIAKEGGASVIQHGKQVLSTAIVPVGGVILGPKAIDAVVNFASKGEPMLGRAANATLVKV